MSAAARRAQSAALCSARPQTVKAQLEQVLSDYGAEEAIVVSITYSHEARLRSYELLAEAFAL